MLAPAQQSLVWLGEEQIGKVHKGSACGKGEYEGAVEPKSTSTNGTSAFDKKRALSLAVEKKVS